MAGGENDFALRVLARGDALLLRLLDAVVHGVADNVHQGIADAVHDGFVHLRVLAHQCQPRPLAQLFAHVPHNALHFLEGTQHRHHPQRHGNVL
ncbi:hypothetical protein SDC9_85860 [bioreactor metagenome]|uniref:Uncharacterized protein n=1 Tax=bioreactor metagenome TaxID=1076179 RepID=A0A644ZEU8_9ZZZZ